MCAASTAIAEDEPIQVRLSGLWTGTGPDKTEIAYLFTSDGNVRWKANRTNIILAYPFGLKAKYQIRPAKPYWEMDLFEFIVNDPQLKEGRYRAIVEFVDSRTMKIDGKPSNIGERPKNFTQDTITFCCVTKEDYPRYIKQMAQTVPEKESSWARAMLHEAGMAAFPALIAHFNDPTPAHSTRQITGVATIGAECFEILQYQIEVSLPKAHRDFEILTPENAKQWLDAHQGQSLAQLRMTSCQESLRRAQAELAKKPSDEFLQETVKMLREAISNMKKESGSRD